MKLHQPVMLTEAITSLNVKPGKLYIDATYGAGGHTQEILRRGGQVLALDVNPQAVKEAEQDPNLTVVRANFNKLAEVARKQGVSSVAGVLFDFGISSDELEQVPGLSFRRNESLDMRLDPNLGVTAADLLNALPESKLDELFREYGDEFQGRAVARAVAQARQQKKFETTGELVQIIERVKGRQGSKRIHPATQIFQALRIAVNDELGSIEQGLQQASELLQDGGRVVTISFHSGEDRIVKDFFKASGLKILTEHPLIPSEAEVTANPRARSAKLRAAER